MRTTTPTLALLAVLGAAVLTGCSAGGPTAGTATATKTSDVPAASSQTVASACAAAGEALQDVKTDMSESLSGLGTGDVSGAVDAMGTLGDKFAAAEKKVTNPEVKSALQGMADKIGEFGDLLAKAGDGGVAALAADASKIQSLATDVQDAGQKLAKLCG